MAKWKLQSNWFWWEICVIKVSVAVSVTFTLITIISHHNKQFVMSLVSSMQLKSWIEIHRKAKYILCIISMLEGLKFRVYILTTSSECYIQYCVRLSGQQGEYDDPAREFFLFPVFFLCKYSCQSEMKITEVRKTDNKKIHCFRSRFLCKRKDNWRIHPPASVSSSVTGLIHVKTLTLSKRGSTLDVRIWRL